MANVNIKFNGKDFLLSCDDGQEEHLEELLIHINQKFNKLKNDLGNIGENKLLLITSVQIMDEYFKKKKKIEQKKTELKNISDKFRELKSLILEKLKSNNVTILDTIQTFDYGKFVHIMDDEGNKIELWEPIDVVFTKMGGNTTK